MTLKIKRTSVERLGKEIEEIFDYGYARWQKFIEDRLVVITDNSYVLHFNRKLELILSWNGVQWGYYHKFSKGLHFLTISYPNSYINKYIPETNSYTIATVPPSVYMGTEVLGTKYYWRMSSAIPTKLQVFDLDGNLIKEIDFSNIPEVQPFTHSFSNKEASTFYGWSYYSPNYLVRVNVDGSYQIKDISNLGIYGFGYWLGIVEVDDEAKKVFLVLNARRFGMLDTETLNFEEIASVENLDATNCGVSKNFKYAIVLIDYDKVKIFDLETKASIVKEIFFDATYSLPVFPKITSDGKGYAVFHELYYALISEVRRAKDNKLVDIVFMFYDYPYSIDITEFEV